MNVEQLLATVPDPTADEMNARHAAAQRYTLVLIRKGPSSRDGAAQNDRMEHAHFQHLTKLSLLGKLALVGPILEPNDILGIGVFATDAAEARELMRADPEVRAGYLAVEAVPWMAVGALGTG